MGNQRKKILISNQRKKMKAPIRKSSVCFLKFQEESNHIRRSSFIKNLDNSKQYLVVVANRKRASHK